MMIVKSRVKEAAKHKGKPLIVSSEFMIVFEEKVNKLLRESCRRAYENGRVTVKPKDI